MWGDLGYIHIEVFWFQSGWRWWEIGLRVSVAYWIGVNSQDPRLIAEISSNPRLIPYHSSNSVPTILWDSDTMLTKPPNSEHPRALWCITFALWELQMTSENPNHIPVFICLHHSVLVLLNSELTFMSSSQFSPFQFWYIKRFSTLALLF